MPSRPTRGAGYRLARLAEALFAVTLVAVGWMCGFVYVEGSSMEPTLSAGDIVVYRRHGLVPTDGDVVLFEHDGSLVVHRVVKVEADGAVRTRGDANATADAEPVPKEQLRGEIVLVVPTGAIAERLAARAH